MRTTCPWVVIVFVTITLWPAAIARTAQRVQCDGPLSNDDIALFLKEGVTETRVRQLVAACGTDFIPTPEMERTLRSLGATNALLSALHPPSDPAVGTSWLSPIDRRPMVWVPPGVFEMGSPPTEAGRDEDEPRNSIRIERGFWLDASEVTNEAYRRFVLANPQWQKGRIERKHHDGNYLAHWRGTEYEKGKGDEPVVNVSSYAAAAYAAWAGKRLPTEAEWEYATRAGTRTAYWWGDSYPARAADGTDPAPRKNPWALLDMLGSVWEWTSTAPASYPYRPDDGREDPRAGERRVIRGGAKGSAPAFLRAANRNSDLRERCSDLVGFRCALSVIPNKERGTP